MELAGLSTTIGVDLTGFNSGFKSALNTAGTWQSGMSRITTSVQSDLTKMEQIGQAGLKKLGGGFDTLASTAQSGLGKVEGAASKASAALASVGTVAGAGLTAGIGLAVAGFGALGAAAVGNAADAQASVGMLESRLGVTGEEAKRLGDIGVTVFKNNWGGSIGETTEGVGTLQQGLRGLVDESDLSALTGQAFALRDTFGIELPESTRLAAQLIKTGLAEDGGTALNIITAGFQNNLNAADDLSDTLLEYSDDFARMGFSGNEALAIINRGLDAGIFNTDKIGDSLNEFGVRLRDPAIGEALSTIDTQALEMYQQFQRGEITERQALEGLTGRFRLSKIRSSRIKRVLRCSAPCGKT